MTGAIQRRFLAWPALLALALPGAAEIIDRIAATVGTKVITESMVMEQIRLAAFYDNKEPEFSPASKRKGADTLISQTLLVQEMDDTRYPDPPMSEVLQYLKDIIMPRFPNEEAYRKELARRRLTDEEVRRFLQLMIRSVDFIDLRFGRGQQVSSAEIAAWYRDQFLPEYAKSHPGKPAPPLDDVSDQIETALLKQKTDAATEEWLKQARAGANIRYREEVFQ
ncbi:MAG: hypothetical protein IT165_09680 [Bryobacterales bacterium]|nr:hypothetical protein [Bryobacterales bacterium]